MSDTLQERRMTQFETKEYVGYGDYKFSNVEEFGYSFKEFVAGTPIPRQGAHINLYASGPFRGEKMDANMELVDHVQLLPGGRIELNIYGVLTDREGRRVFFHSTGVAELSSAGMLPLAENIYMHSNHAAYDWMNAKQFWANGVVDPRDMTLRVHVFSAGT
jgi:hypothetical protein